MPIVQATNSSKFENRLWDLFTENNDSNSKQAKKLSNKAYLGTGNHLQ
jgi:hypothetical protein